METFCVYFPVSKHWRRSEVGEEAFILPNELLSTTQANLVLCGRWGCSAFFQKDSGFKFENLMSGFGNCQNDKMSSEPLNHLV